MLKKTFSGAHARYLPCICGTSKPAAGAVDAAAATPPDGVSFLFSFGTPVGGEHEGDDCMFSFFEGEEFLVADVLFCWFHKGLTSCLTFLSETLKGSVMSPCFFSPPWFAILRRSFSSSVGKCVFM